MPLFGGNSKQQQSGTKPANSIFRSANEQLRHAAAHGDLKVVQELVAKGAKCLPDRDGRTALHFAAIHGSAEIVRFLLENGCELNVQDKLGYSALQRASIEGHTEVVRILLDGNAAIDLQDVVQENTALHETAWHGHAGCMDMLLTARANLYIRNKSGSTALHLACQNGHNQCTRLLIHRGCKVDVKDKYDDTPLHTACRYLHAKVTKLLLVSGANPNEVNKNGDTPLHLSCNIGQRKLVKILLEANADFKIKNKQLESPVDIAVKKQRKELLDLFSGKSGGTGGNGTHPKQTKNGPIIQHPTTLSRDRRKKIRERLQASRDYGSNWQLLFQDWAPFGWVNPTAGTNGNLKCPHLYPPQAGYNPKVAASNGLQTLGKGEQYFVDLAGNVHKGPIGTTCACYCAPFFFHLARQNTEVQQELLDEIDACHVELSNEITDLRHVTERRLANIDQTLRQRLANQRLANQLRMRQSRPKVENNGGFPAFQRRFLEQNPPLTRSKSESELETDAERERTIPIKDDNSDSLSNASDDLYMDPSLRNMKILEKHQQQNQKMLRFSHDTSYSGSSDHQPPPASPHSNIASLIHAKFEASARRFNAIESSDHLQESSCTTPLTSWSSHPCTSEGSNRNSVSSYQSHHSSISVPLSQTQSFQQSLDSGYGTNIPNNPSIDSALPSPQVEYHLPPMQQSTTSLKLEAETQTDSGESHEYTELDGSVVMRPKPKGSKKDRPPPVLPIPPPPNKPLPPLPENGTNEMTVLNPRSARRRQLKPIPKGTQKNEVGAQNGRPLVSTNV